MKKIVKKLGILLAFVPMLALILGSCGFGALPASAEAQDSNSGHDCSQGVNGGIAAGVNCGKSSSTPDNLFGSNGIFKTVINIMLFAVGVLAVIMIIFSGIRYASSRGDPKAVEAAKNTLLYSIVGLVISIFAYAIVNWVVFAATNNTAS